jgi:hypothetical protein
MAETKKNYFEELFKINVNDKVEKKNGLSYVSWSYAWAELKKIHPDANYTIYENADGWNYFSDGRTCWVKTGVTVNGIEHIEYLPVMDFKNKSIPANAVTSFDVNKAIQRSLTKAVARHGLGLYIYAGEDLPENDEAVATPAPAPKAQPKATPKAQPAPAPEQTEAEPIKKVVVSEKSKKIRQDYVKFCKENDVAIKKSLTNTSSDKDFEDALAEARAEVASREGGDLPFPL